MVAEHSTKDETIQNGSRANRDTEEVKEAKEQFFRTFNNALNGIIETVYIEDTTEVKERKEEFFKTFDSAMNNLLTTVETAYLEDTLEVKEAKVRFNQAYADAEEGKIGAQYLEDTPEVKVAKKRFFRYFDFVLDGMLDKLSPKPGYNVIPVEIADHSALLLTIGGQIDVTE